MSNTIQKQSAGIMSRLVEVIKSQKPTAHESGWLNYATNIKGTVTSVSQRYVNINEKPYYWVNLNINQETISAMAYENLFGGPPAEGQTVMLNINVNPNMKRVSLICRPVNEAAIIEEMLDWDNIESQEQSENAF